MGLDLTVFFTRGVSLRTWAEIGMFEREVALYRRLQGKGVGVRFVTYGDRGELDFANDIAGIDVRCNRWRLPAGLYGALVPWLHADALRATAVVKSNQVQGADVALASARRFKKAFVARCGYLHSDFMAAAHGEQSPQARSARELEAKVFGGADRVVVTTAAMRDTITERYGLNGNNVRVIPNFVDTDVFRPLDGERRRRVCFVGRLVEQKNVFAMLEAVRGLDVDAVIVGDGHLRPALEAEAKRDGITAHFLGNRPHRELPEILGGCAVFVLPSRYEGQPKTLLEAMACGLAVVGADVPGIREVIRHGETGYLCPPSPEGLRAAILALMDDADRRARLGRAAREFVVENFSLDRVVESEYALLRELAA